MAAGAEGYTFLLSVAKCISWQEIKCVKKGLLQHLNNLIQNDSTAFEVGVALNTHSTAFPYFPEKGREL